MKSRARSQVQTAFRVLVATAAETLAADRGDLWDSGRVASDRCTAIRFAGKAIPPGAACHWKVRVWDKKGRESAWSEPAFWRAGLFDASEWKGAWIGCEKPLGRDDAKSEMTRCAARMLRKEFDLAAKPRTAVAFYSGLGLSELYCNGRKAGDAVLSPGLSEYRKRFFYVTQDVTGLLKPGRNALAVLLGNGRYFAPRRDGHVEAMTFPKLLLELRMTFDDGSAMTVATDTTWRLSADGPITANNEFDGEAYDARRETPGWTAPEFDDASWRRAESVPAPAGRPEAQPIRPIRVVQTLKPVSSSSPRKGVTVTDLGQNMVGWVRIRLRNARPGETVRLRFAETLKPDGTLYTANLRSARAEDAYTARGDSLETWEPRFTYHGFRYVENSGPPVEIEGRVVSDDLEPAGTFDCSHPVVNRTYRNAVWGIRGNYRSLPTDCPQRDERQGWLGDRALGALGESYVNDLHALYAKWLGDIRDSQNEAGSIPDVAPTFWKIYSDNTTWPGAYLFLADMLRAQYADSDLVRDHYPHMKRWVDHMGGYVRDDLMPKDTYGDWCVPPESPLLIHSRDPGRATPAPLIGTAYFAREAELMEGFARGLGRPDDARAFGALAERMRAGLNLRLLDRSAANYGNGSATSNLLPLAFGLAPDSLRGRVFDRIVAKIMADFDGHTPVGLVGAQWIMRTLTAFGRPDLAFRLATNTDYPSWGYMSGRGATTIWELWNGDTADPAMNSGNHVMLLGDLLAWLYEDLAGIRPDPAVPGFRRLVMRPAVPPGLTRVRASYRSPQGLIASEWGLESGRFTWTVTLPPNTEAELFLPAASEKDVMEGGRPAVKAEGVSFRRRERGRAVFAAGSGVYRFTVSPFSADSLPPPFTDTPVISPGDTTVAFPAKVRVTLSCPTPGARIRYTLDGTGPTEHSTVYEAPFETDRYAVVTARAFLSGRTASFSRTSVIDVVRPDVNGLRFSYYEGDWKALPDFRSLRPLARGRAAEPDPSASKRRADRFGLVYEGSLFVPADGPYAFHLSSDDGSRLILNGRTVAVNDSVHAVTSVSGAVTLTRGRHPVRIEFFDGLNDEALRVDLSGPGLPRQPVPRSFWFPK